MKTNKIDAIINGKRLKLERFELPASTQTGVILQTIDSLIDQNRQILEALRDVNDRISSLADTLYRFFPDTDILDSIAEDSIEKEMLYDLYGNMNVSCWDDLDEYKKIVDEELKRAADSGFEASYSDIRDIALIRYRTQH